MRARLAIWGVVLIWAANFSVIKYALADFRPFAFNALRFPLASVVLLAFWVGSRRGPARPRSWAASRWRAPTP